MLSFIFAKISEKFCVHLGTKQNLLDRFFENKINDFVCKLKVNSWNLKNKISE